MTTQRRKLTPSSGTPAPSSVIQAPNLPVHVEPTSQDTPPSRSLIVPTSQGAPLIPVQSAVTEMRALPAMHVRGLPQGGVSIPVVEQRTLHAEADGRLSVLQRTVQPLVKTTSRWVSYGGLAFPSAWTSSR